MSDLELTELLLVALAGLIGVIYWSLNERISKLENGKVDKDQCALREQQENKAFAAIEKTLDKLDDTFDRKSTDVVGQMSTITSSMENILSELQRKRRTR